MWTILEDRSKRLQQSICKNENSHLSERGAVWTIQPASVNARYGVAHRFMLQYLQTLDLINLQASGLAFASMASAPNLKHYP